MYFLFQIAFRSILSSDRLKYEVECEIMQPWLGIFVQELSSLLSLDDLFSFFDSYYSHLYLETWLFILVL